MSLVGFALAWDLLLGEPPAAFHPVVWMGSLISWAERVAPHRAWAQLFWGGLLTAALIVISSSVGVAILQLPTPWRELLGVYFLKSSFALRELLASGVRVARALEAQDVEQARTLLSRIVSRSVAELTPAQIAAAAVQSISENLSDSVVAPLFYYAIGGLPAALLYRAVNTLDAMIGYRGRYEYLGKIAARVDDVLNFVPARLTAFLLLLLGALFRRPGWRVWWRDRQATASPNGGHPMAAAAGILRVEIEKVGCYRLGDGPAPQARTIVLMNRYAFGLSLLVVGLAACAR